MSQRVAPIQIGVFDKNFVPKGAIGNPKFVTINLRHNAIGTATVCVQATHRLMPNLLPGNRLHIRDENSEHLMSGYIERIRGRGPTGSGYVEIDINDDFAMLGEVLGWVIPDALISAQGTAGANWEMTDNAETVLKAAVTENAIDRLAMPVVCAPDLGRGSVITGKLRFHPIYDRLFPVVDGAGLEAAGIGVTVRQVDDHLEVDVYEPSTYPRDLTEAGGAIVDWNYSLAGPTATRVTVGGQGEAQARAFRHYIDAARETEYARVIERFRDARDVDDVADLPVRGQETLDEGAPKSGLSLVLSETKNLRYGSSVRVGDQVNMSIGITPISDVLKEAVLSWTSDAGWRVTPKVGDRSDDTDTMMASALRRLARWISNQTRT